MKKHFRIILNIFVFILVISIQVQTTNNNTYAGVGTGNADLVLGQGRFDKNAPNLIDGRGLDGPTGVAVDDATNMVAVVDFNNHRVLLWDDYDSMVNGEHSSIVLGQEDEYCYSANRGDTVSANTLNEPWDVIFDTTGNLWVSDKGNHRILRYSAPFSNGQSADLVLGQANFTSNQANRGGGSAANTLNEPCGLAIDKDGYLFVADRVNHRISRYSPPFSNGMDGDSFSLFGYPLDVAVDADGNIWVADTKNHRVLMFTTFGGFPPDLILGFEEYSAMETYTCNRREPFTGACPPAANTLCEPSGIIVDVDGNVWVSDKKNERVLRYSAPFTDGMDADLVLGQLDFVTASCMCSGNCIASSDIMRSPTGLALDSTGRLYVCDTTNNRVLRFEGPYSNGMASTLVLGQALFTLNSKNLIDGTGFGSPTRIYIDAINSRSKISNVNDNRTLWWNNIENLSNTACADGVLGQENFYFSSANRDGAPSANSLKVPYGIGVDDLGKVWICDMVNNRVLRYSPPITNGMDADLVLGQADFSSNLDNRGGGPMANTLYRPDGIVIDNTTGKIWVSDYANHRILRYSPPFSNGMDADLILGQADFTSNEANRGGDPAANTLYLPAGIMIDSSENLWVTDSANSRILRYSSPFSNGMDADLVLGQADFTSNEANRGGGTTVNTLKGPFGITIDDLENIFVTDAGNNRVLKYSPPFINGMDADLVLGQEDFTSSLVNRGGDPGVNTLYGPWDVTVQNGIWIVEYWQNRVIKFNSLKVLSLSHNSGYNTGTINIDITGDEYVGVAEVFLRHDSFPEIIASDVDINSLEGLSCSFDLLGKQPGIYDVWVKITVAHGTVSAVLRDGFEIKGSNLSIETETLPDGIVNVSYSETIQATGGVYPYKWSIIDGVLPSGLELDTGTGTISGIPDISDTFIFTIRVEDSSETAQSDTGLFSIRIIEGIRIKEKTLKEGRIFEMYSEIIEAEGGVKPHSFSLVEGYLPDGLILDELTGEISGIPERVSANNEYEFKIGVIDSGVIIQSDTKMFSINILGFGSLEDVKVYPNPFKPKKEKELIFDNLPENTRVRIYSVNGELINELEFTKPKESWDGKNKKGKTVSSGVYFLEITNKGSQILYKISLIK